MVRYLPLGIIILLFSLSVRQHLFVDCSHPPSFQIQDFPLLEQPDEITCGPTSVAMVLKFYHLNGDIKDVEKETKTEWLEINGSHVGMTSPDYLPYAASKFGLQTSLISGSIDRLKHEVSLRKPVVVLVRSGKTTWHYVVVIGFTENDITLADPCGVQWDLPISHFQSAWRFTTDLQGRDVIESCPVCHGKGRWLPENFGPLGICNICNGSGKQFDYAGSLVRTVDAAPLLMIVPR